MILVIAIDKDNDYGRKGGVECPVVGKEAVLKAVLSLGFSDPEDSDLNVGLAAVKIAEEVHGTPVIVCGEGKNGFRDDMEIHRQLSILKERFGDEKVIIVTDGSEDESVIPIVSSKFEVVGLERVTVKQLEGVETFYYIVVKYLKELLSSKETARLFLGIPGIVVLLIGFSTIVSTWYPNFYNVVRNFIVGVGLLLFGGYIFKIGFGLDLSVPSKKDFVTIAGYFLIAFTAVVGAAKGYFVYKNFGFSTVVLYYVMNLITIMLIVYSGIRVVSEYLNGRERLLYYISFMAFIPAIYSGLRMIVDYVMTGSVELVTGSLFFSIIVFSSVLSGMLYRKGKKKFHSKE